MNLEAARERESELTAALAKIEHELEMPSVPGELSEWSKQICEATEAMIGQLRTEHQTRHPQILQEIGEEDTEMLPRVEQLQQADREVLEQWERFLEQARQFVLEAESAEKDELQVAALREELVDSGLRAVVTARKQEIALATWLTEALQRDRGDVD